MEDNGGEVQRQGGSVLMTMLGHEEEDREGGWCLKRRQTEKDTGAEEDGGGVRCRGG